MIRPLLIIAGAGVVLSAVCIGGAVALGGQDLFQNGWVIRDGDWGGAVHVGTDFEDVDESNFQTRSLPWTGGDRLDIRAPGRIVYVQSEDAGVEVAGSPETLARLVVEGGVIRLSDGRARDAIRIDARGVHPLSGPGALRITVRAPNVSRFEHAGAGSLEIRAYDQPSLEITSSGAAEIRADGKTQTVNLTLRGASDADLSALEADRAVYAILGSGEIESAAVRDADVRVSGSGEVHFPRRPERVNQQILGSGDVTFGADAPAESF